MNLHSLTDPAIRALCIRAAAQLPVRHILKNDVVSGHVVNQADVYLSRHYIHPRIDPMQRADLPPPPWAAHLHHFNRSDADFELHNHPWEWSCSLILTGGYREERRLQRADGSYFVHEFTYKPGEVNFLRSDTFHRVELLDPKNGAWTLFLAGPRIQGWGFWDRDSHHYTPWKEFIEARHPPAVNERTEDDQVWRD